MRVPEWLQRLDNAVIGFVRDRSIQILRIAIGIVFIWFGALKIFGISPIADVVVATLFFLPAQIAVVGMGLIELIIGIGLLSGLAMRVVLLLFLLQMLGTFVTMIVRPDLAFNGNPLELTTTGEFIIKNLVLISAGLVILGAVPKAPPSQDLPEMLVEGARGARVSRM